MLPPLPPLCYRRWAVASRPAHGEGVLVQHILVHMHRSAILAQVKHADHAGNDMQMLNALQSVCVVCRRHQRRQQLSGHVLFLRTTAILSIV